MTDAAKTGLRAKLLRLQQGESAKNGLLLHMQQFGNAPHSGLTFAMEAGHLFGMKERPAMLKYALLAAVLLTIPATAADGQPIDGKKEIGPSVTAAGPQVPRASLCEGDGCDAYLPAALFTPRYRDEEGMRRRNAVIGAASGAIIGEKVGGLPAAIGLASLGAAMGYNQSRAEMEARARAYDAAWIRGDDIYYNPVYSIPVNPHYWGGKRK